VTLRLIGPAPPAIAFRDDRIVATGFVDDLAEALDRISLVLAPIEFGGGMRVKVIEALAAGKVVVGTELALAGLPLELRRVAITATTDRQFAAAAVELLADPGELARRGAQCRAAALAWLDLERAADRYDDLYAHIDELRAGQAVR